MDRYDLESYINENGIRAETIAMGGKVRTAEQAAEEVGAELSQIIKSLVFMVDGEPVTVIAPGNSKVDTEKLKEITGADKCRLADKNEVRRLTGYSVGEVPPIGIDMTVYIDREVMENEIVYGGGGSDKHLLKINPKNIERHNQSKIISVTE